MGITMDMGIKMDMKTERKKFELKMNLEKEIVLDDKIV